MEALFTYCKVTCAFDWQKENDYSTYTFGSVAGAQKWVDNNINKLVWYSIEELEVRPCNENDPGGHLHYGIGYFEFKDKNDLKELKE